MPNKTERFYEGLRQSVASKIELKGFGKGMMIDAIKAGRTFVSNQTILKRAPKIRDSNIWGFACSVWLELLLESEHHNSFSTFDQFQDWLWRVIAPTGYANHVNGYDTECIRIMQEYKGLLREWYWKSHQDEKNAAATAQALVNLQQMNPEVIQAMRDIIAIR